jgi:tRNA(His) 5'-end guanylyltransferase
MKAYEAQETAERFMPMVPIVARIDGRSFHSLTRGMQRPFDHQFMQMMADTCQFLVRETRAVIGYTQSDEINLVFNTDDPRSQVFFDGRKFKMVSGLSAMAAVYFHTRLMEHGLDELARRLWYFDCRCHHVPNKGEVCNYLLWRERDATRNSIQMVGQAHFSAKELHRKSTSDIQDMLMERHGINWNDFTPSEKRGSYFRRITIQRPFTAAELDTLPERHEARSNPDLGITRKDVVPVILPPFGRIKNPLGVVFGGYEAIVHEDGDRGADEADRQNAEQQDE